MSLRLSKRDLRVLAKCAVCRWLTTGQLQRLYFPDVTQDAARKSLRRLSKAEHLVSFRENPMAEALYGVGSEGKSLLATKGLEVQSCRTPPGQVEHLIGVNDIRISIEADPNRLAYFFASWELPQFQWGHAVIPDAVFALKHPERRTFVVEYDRGTETRERLFRKFLAYAAGLSDFSFDAAILITDTPERLAMVGRHLRHRLVSVRLLGATLSTIKAVGIHAAGFLDICSGSEVPTLLSELSEPAPLRSSDSSLREDQSTGPLPFAFFRLCRRDPSPIRMVKNTRSVVLFGRVVFTVVETTCQHRQTDCRSSSAASRPRVRSESPKARCVTGAASAAARRG
jgi:hypothetical protein